MLFFYGRWDFWGNTLALTVYFYGDLINRSVNIRCERHRTTDSELLLALGLTHVVPSLLIDYCLPSTPWLIRRTLKHGLLLWNINTAAHMDIPYVEPHKGTLAIDPIVGYELFNSFMTDIALAGSMSKIVQIFTPEPNKPPIVSISWILQTVTSALNSDLEKVNPPKDGLIKTTAKHIVPPVFRSTRNTVRDPVLRIFWPDMQEFLLEIMGYVIQADTSINTINESNVPFVAASVKKVLPKVLFEKYDVPKKATRFLLRLCAEKDFHPFLLALQQWLDRHNLRERIVLADIDPSTISTLYHGSPKLPPPTKEQQEQINIPVTTLKKETGVEVHPESLTRQKSRYGEQIDLTLFGTGARKTKWNKTTGEVTPQNSSINPNQGLY